MAKLSSILVSLLIPLRLFSQMPEEGAKLHYRIIAFSSPTPELHKPYTLELADGNITDERRFTSRIIKKITSSENAIIAEVPQWGRQYTWRIVFRASGADQKRSVLHHFSTMVKEELLPSNSRFRVLQHASKFADCYVFLNSYGALYDMNGKAVWFIPPFIGEKGAVPRDLKISPSNTITFMMGEQIYDINYNGNILWAKQKDSAYSDITRFHHQFSQTAKGNYMVLGNEVLWQKLNTGNDSPMTLIPVTNMYDKPPDSNYAKVIFGTVLEYDRHGKLIWSWNSSNYFATSDIVHRRLPNGRLNTITHENAFFFDEKKGFIYISYKGISRIVKVKYPEGNVVASYGEKFDNGPEKKNPLFCGQHSCMISRKGYLYLYDNNVCNPGCLSRIVMMKEPEFADGNLKPVWTYDCTVERTPENKYTNYAFPSGGNVIELSDGSIFACMGGSYSKVFIISPEKKILWSALAEQWDTTEHKWTALSQYRASIITSKELKNLILSSRK